MSFLLAASLIAAQSPAPAPSASPFPRPAPVLRVMVGLVQVDAVVTDGKGRHVTDLGPADFVLEEGGEVREIAQVSYVATAPAVRQVIEQTGAPSTDPTAQVAAPSRLITLVVDDLNISFENMIGLKDTLRRFVAETLTPTDRVALVRTGGGMGTMQQFTSDRRVLSAAIERVRFNPMGAARANDAIDTEMPFGGGPAGGSPSGRASRQEAEHQADRMRSELIAVGTLGTLRSVVRGLAPLPGRKALVFFSDGLPSARAGEDRRVEGGMSDLTDEANRASVTLYTIDTRGLFNPGLHAEDNVSQVGVAEVNRVLAQRVDEGMEAREGLRSLAEWTGGFMVSRSNDLSRAIQTVVADQQGYYLIGYVPPASMMESKPGPLRFHKLTVSVRRPGLRVRSRSGFYGVPDAETPPPASRDERLRTALLSPFAAADIPLRLLTVFLDDEKAGPSLRAMLHLDENNVTFASPAPDAQTRQATLDVVAVTFGERGEPVDQKNQTFTIRAARDADPSSRNIGLFYTVDLPVKRPGAYQFRVVVRDVVSDRLGAAGQFVDVPDLKKERLALSGIVMRDVGADGEASRATETLVGRVRAGNKVEYVFQVLNARRDPVTKRTRLTVGARLWKGRQLLYDGAPAPLTVEPADPTRVAAGGRLNLSPRLPPGDYALEVTVTDALAGKGKNVATRWTDLEVVSE